MMYVSDKALEVMMKSLSSASPIWACFLHLDRGDDTAEPPLWRWLTSQRWSLYWQSTDLGGVEYGAGLYFILKSFYTHCNFLLLFPTRLSSKHPFMFFTSVLWTCGICRKTLLWLFHRNMTKTYWRIIIITWICKGCFLLASSLPQTGTCPRYCCLLVGTLCL